MEHLIFIDDERYFARQYVSELETTYKVTLCRSAAEGMQAMRESDMQAIILDIQMPTPPGVPSHETNIGVDTGIWLLRISRDFLVKNAVPVFVLTNRREDDLDKLISPLRFPNGQIELFHKVHTSPKQFKRSLTTSLLRRAAEAP